MQDQGVTQQDEHVHQTPGRGESPVFAITGQKNDVELAVAEIKNGSADFTNIRA